MVQACGSNVDLIRATFSFVSQRRTARVAESSNRAGISLVAMWFSAFPFEIGTLHDGPRDGLGTGCAPAIFTTTIRRHTWVALDLESNFSAVTSAGDHQFSS